MNHDISFVLSGQATSAGIAIGKANVIKSVETSLSHLEKLSPEEETQRLADAVIQAQVDLTALRDKIKAEVGAAKAEIFDVHLSFLSDPEFIGQAYELIKGEQHSAVDALSEVCKMFTEILETSGDELLVARAADLQDVTHRLQQLIANPHAAEEENSLSDEEESVIIAEDLTPSETAQFKFKKVVGFVTSKGSITSHASILARAMGIPMITGVSGVTNKIEPGSWIIVDAKNGQVLVDPPPAMLNDYRARHEQDLKKRQEIARFAALPSLTADGYSLSLAANIGQPEDLGEVQENGADEIGLFRSEFAYMHRNTLPSENELYQGYAKILSGMAPKSVIIRTLDIGGDKQLATLPPRKEENPFLGTRAVRLCLAEQNLFRPQVRALLRASVHGNLKIMLPMIAIESEIDAVLRIIQEEKEALLKQGIAVSNNIKIGIMLEIPAALVMVDQLAKKVDFFSIGTNDLVQYTMAADRMNENLAYLQTAYHPAILRLIAHATKATRLAGKWIGLCGEMGGDVIALPILVGLGLHEISMNAIRIPEMRANLSMIEHHKACVIAERCLELNSAEEVKNLIQTNFPELFNQ